MATTPNPEWLLLMELDACGLERGTLLDADVCIIGAGPAGITLAGEFTSRHSVVLLESGGTRDDQELQRLNDGIVIGSPYHGLRRTRHRQVGGSAHLWNTAIERLSGAKYAPLEPLDFEVRPDIPLSGWPFGFRDLEPFYRRAHLVCGLGAFEYGGSHWENPDRPFLLGSDVLTTGVYHCGLANRFTQTYPAQLRASQNVRVLYYATCCVLRTDSAGRIIEAEIKSRAKRTFRVTARVFVLAAGAVENARLLLASSGNQAVLGNQGDWVGRCFMEHPRDYALRVIPKSADVFQRIAFYDLHRSRDGSWVIGRLGLGHSVLQSHRFPNASITLLPRPRRRPWLEAIGASFGSLGVALVERRATVGYGWSARPNVRRRCDSIQVLVNVEQFPQAENRVLLAQERDEYGVLKAELHWRWRDDEQASLDRLRAFVAAQLGAMGLGRVEVTNELRPDPNAHHHAGTTRLSADSHRGVADADCRVHGTENLYLAGASLFPTAGFANPTLTVVALAIRLGDHLKAKLQNLSGAMISR